MVYRSPLSLAFGVTVASALALSGCSAGSGDNAGNGNGNGGPNGTGGSSGGGVGGPNLGAGGLPPGSTEGCGAVLPAVFRDFKGFGEPGGHTDFEISARGVVFKNAMDLDEVYRGFNDVGCGLVEPTLGATGKPTFYAGPAEIIPMGPMMRGGVGRLKRVVTGPGCWPSTTGVCFVGSCVPWNFNPPTYEIESAASLAQWYTTTPGVNLEIPVDLPLTETAAGSGVYLYDSNAFFPLDNQGFGTTPGQAHNYHFTTEIHVKFGYQAGQVFTFRGDDDLWIFVNGKLALDVGGLHEDLEGSINFDAQAAALGITVGSTYQMDIFHAERQTSESNFRIETNIRCFERVPVK